jgi:flagellar hook-basal body complex protein FliE
MASIDAIGSVTSAQSPQGPQGPGAVRRGDSGWMEVGGGKGVSFADTLKHALGEVSELQDRSRDAIAAFVRGEPVELHEVMAAAEEAGLALEFLIEIRNKITDAYRSVINMQA